MVVGEASYGVSYHRVDRMALNGGQFHRKARRLVALSPTSPAAYGSMFVMIETLVSELILPCLTLTASRCYMKRFVHS